MNFSRDRALIICPLGPLRHHNSTRFSCLCASVLFACLYLDISTRVARYAAYDTREASRTHVHAERNDQSVSRKRADNISIHIRYIRVRGFRAVVAHVTFVLRRRVENNRRTIMTTCVLLGPSNDELIMFTKTARRRCIIRPNVSLEVTLSIRLARVVMPVTIVRDHCY